MVMVLSKLVFEVCNKLLKIDWRFKMKYMWDWWMIVVIFLFLMFLVGFRLLLFLLQMMLVWQMEVQLVFWQQIVQMMVYIVIWWLLLCLWIMVYQGFFLFSMLFNMMIMRVGEIFGFLFFYFIFVIILVICQLM